MFTFNHLLYKDDCVLLAPSPRALHFLIDDVAELPPCIPRESLVTVPTDPNEPNVINWPSCVTAKRCGGCCSNELFDCQATRSEIVQKDVSEQVYKETDFRTKLRFFFSFYACAQSIHSVNLLIEQL